MAMSNLPSISPVSWNTELGVSVIFGSTTCLANMPFSCATQIGRFQPPGNTMRFTGLGGAGWAAQPASAIRSTALNSVRMALLLSTANGNKASQQHESDEQSREQQRQAGEPLPKRRVVVLRVARRRVSERIEREGEGPPGRTERPAQQPARIDEQADQQRERHVIQI